MKKVVKLLKQHIGLILFFIAVITFVILWTDHVEKTNERITNEKNAKYGEIVVW